MNTQFRMRAIFAALLLGLAGAAHAGTINADIIQVADTPQTGTVGGPDLVFHATQSDYGFPAFSFDIVGPQTLVLTPFTDLTWNPTGNPTGNSITASDFAAAYPTFIPVGGNSGGPFPLVTFHLNNPGAGAQDIGNYEFAVNLQDANGHTANGDAYIQFTVNAASLPAPEPETYALMGLGLAGLAWMRRRKA